RSVSEVYGVRRRGFEVLQHSPDEPCRIRLAVASLGCFRQRLPTVRGLECAFAAFQHGLHGIIASRHGQKGETILLGLAFRWSWAKSSAAAAAARGFDSRFPAIIAIGCQLPGGSSNVIFRAGIRGD